MVTSVCAGPGAGLDGPGGSLPAQDVPDSLPGLEGGSADGKGTVPRHKSVL